jgi:hypothetical protein
VSDTPSDPPQEPPRLDPDLAAAAASERQAPKPEPVIDTRPYRWTIGIFGLALLIAFSVYTFASHGVGTAGVPPGHRIHLFVAPLATSALRGDANVHPRCDPAHPNPLALNICGHSPLVLARSFRRRHVQFAAVAVQAGRAETTALIRSHHWTIPIAYDRDGAVGALYGVAICPMVELARTGGVVTDRLIGSRWLRPAALAARVNAMLARR